MVSGPTLHFCEILDPATREPGRTVVLVTHYVEEKTFDADGNLATYKRTIGRIDMQDAATGGTIDSTDDGAVFHLSRRGVTVGRGNTGEAPKILMTVGP